MTFFEGRLDPSKPLTNSKGSVWYCLHCISIIILCQHTLRAHHGNYFQLTQTSMSKIIFSAALTNQYIKQLFLCDQGILPVYYVARHWANIFLFFCSQ